MSAEAFTPPSIQWFLRDEESATKGNPEGKAISTFKPEVLSLIKVITSTGIEFTVRIKLHFEKGESGEFTIPLSAIDDMDWFKKDKRCLLNPQYRRANNCIANLIRAGMAGIDEEKTTELRRLDHLGINILGDVKVFVAGDQVITRPSDKNSLPKYDVASSPFRLDIDPNLTPKDAFEGMRELVCLSPEIGRILVAHTISGITRSAFKDVRFVPCAVLVIIGSTGMLKSHYVPHITQLYNRNDAIGKATRFNSTTRFIEDILHDYCECTAVVDDICSAESRSIKRTNETAAEEIIRRIGDDIGRGIKVGNSLAQVKFRGNVVFIGEYTFGKESTIPRALVANLQRRLMVGY